MARVLVACDDHDMARFVAFLHRDAGHEAETAHSWDEVVERLPSGWDVLVLHPHAGAGTVLPAVEADARHAELVTQMRVVVFSAWDAGRAEAAIPGAAGYVSGPFDVRELLALTVG